MNDTRIEWCNRVWNPVTVCTNEVLLHEDRLDQLRLWQKPWRVFVNSTSDLFQEAVPFEFIDRVIDATSEVARSKFLVLTKRPQRMLEYQRWRNQRIPAASFLDGQLTWPSNWWLGVSCEDQRHADERIPIMVQLAAAVRWVSLEPLLGPIDLRGQWHGISSRFGTIIDWVVVGGESGPKARPCNLEWIRSIVTQCRTAGVPVFVKQLGSRSTWCGMGQGPRMIASKGGNPAEWPEDLRVREFPFVEVSG